jgi:hypothetical protein
MEKVFIPEQVSNRPTDLEIEGSKRPSRSWAFLRIQLVHAITCCNQSSAWISIDPWWHLEPRDQGSFGWYFSTDSPADLIQ